MVRNPTLLIIFSIEKVIRAYKRNIFVRLKRSLNWFGSCITLLRLM